MRIQLRAARAAMAEIVLNDSQVDARFEQMGGIRMSKSMYMRRFDNAALPERAAERLLQAGHRHGPWFCRKNIARHDDGEHPRPAAMDAPMRAQQLQGSRRQRNITIFTAFAMNAQQHSRTVDIRNLEMRSLRDPQPAGVNRRQTNTIGRHSDFLQDAPYLLAA